ncbi:hypothetical protein [Allorhodopirellula solitaria]|uniref:Uncharacterized protein n=1 Tax=Allorhodopirellula solitaria TaxID=2527987 RepID=A0A5C5X0Z8_9BACT|nr:hypothetical protein [Allorhodopirellula solitaria]TWT55882.1 hypothetical protein CA85_47800 [Allorhodopirellula solitaria]
MQSLSTPTLRIRAVLAIAVALGGITDATSQDAQTQSPPSEIPIINTVIESWPVDAAMTRQQEQAIWKKLCQPYTPLATRIPLDRWVDSVASLCPLQIDRYSLEGIGLTADTELQFRLDRPPQPLLVHLLLALKPLECVLEIEHGVVQITTRDAAEYDLPMRLYDVSPLVDGSNAQERLAAAKLLIHTIQYVIDPEDWEVLGGTSVIQLQPAKSKLLFCVAAKTQTHWKLQAFVDQLQRARDETLPLEPAIPNRSNRPVSPAAVGEPERAPEQAERTPRSKTALPRFQPR